MSELPKATQSPHTKIVTVARIDNSTRANHRVALHIAASALWRVPGRFGIARILGGAYSLRCIVFHNVSATESSFTGGMGVSITPSDFERAVQFLAKHYNPVCLQDVLDAPGGRALPPRSVLVTFDDGYASVMETAIPLCEKLGVPAVLFLNAAYLNNQRLSADNLVCYVANTIGMEAIDTAARSVKGDSAPKLSSLMEVFGHFLPPFHCPKENVFSRRSAIWERSTSVNSLRKRVCT